MKVLFLFSDLRSDYREIRFLRKLVKRLVRRNLPFYHCYIDYKFLKYPLDPTSVLSDFQM